MSSVSGQDRVSAVRRYFALTDQGRREVLDLFHEDAELYFPKFGFASGRQSLFDIVKGFEGVLEFLQYDYDTMNIIPAGEYVVVEGTSHGKMLGKSWAGGTTPGGRFCNVFRFRDDRIASLHIYLDPDYTSEDEARFRWGKQRRW
jgi:ketosteroid isomerase-like protein